MSQAQSAIHPADCERSRRREVGGGDERAGACENTNAVQRGNRHITPLQPYVSKCIEHQTAYVKMHLLYLLST